MLYLPSIHHILATNLSQILVCLHSERQSLWLNDTKNLIINSSQDILPSKAEKLPESNKALNLSRINHDQLNATESLLKVNSRKANMPPLLNYSMFLIFKSQIVLNEIIIAACLIKKYHKKIGRICPLNYYKLFAISIYISQKMYREKKSWSLKDFSFIAGLRPETLKSLEIEFLLEINFEVLITRADYGKMQTLLSTFCKTQNQLLTLCMIYRGY